MKTILLILISFCSFGQVVKPTGMNANGQFIIGSGLNSLAGSGSAPTITLTAAAGSSATSSIVGTNISGKITLNSGTLSLSTGKIMTLTFSGSHSYSGGSNINFSAGDPNFSLVINQIYAITYPGYIELYTRVALSLNTTYIGYYTITGW